MLCTFKPSFSESTESQLSPAFSIMQFGQKLMILEHFEVPKAKLIFVVFCCFLNINNKKQQIRGQNCPDIAATWS